MDDQISALLEKLTGRAKQKAGDLLRGELSHHDRDRVIEAAATGQTAERSPSAGAEGGEAHPYGEQNLASSSG